MVIVVILILNTFLCLTNTYFNIFEDTEEYHFGPTDFWLGFWPALFICICFYFSPSRLSEPSR